MTCIAANADTRHAATIRSDPARKAAAAAVERGGEVDAIPSTAALNSHRSTEDAVRLRLAPPCRRAGTALSARIRAVVIGTVQLTVAIVVAAVAAGPLTAILADDAAPVHARILHATVEPGGIDHAGIRSPPIVRQTARVCPTHEAGQTLTRVVAGLGFETNQERAPSRGDAQEDGTERPHGQVSRTRR